MKRSDERARSPSAPIASRTCDGCATPAEHAEPVEHATPAASRSSSRASPSQPGKEKCALPGRRSTGSPLSTASGHAARTRSISSSRSAPTRQANASCALTLISTAVAKATMPGTSSVPERTSRSWPPPCSRGVQATSRPSSSAPTPTGPPSLWPVMDRPSAIPKWTGSWPMAWIASVWNGMPRERAVSASSATGCTVPTSLLAHMAVTRATSSSSVSASASGATRPAGSTGSQDTDAPSCDSSQPTASSTAWCSADPDTTRVRAGSAARRAQKMPLTARLSLSVPPLVKMTSDGRAPTAAANCSLASSTRRRACRPAACSDEALPTADDAAT